MSRPTDPVPAGGPLVLGIVAVAALLRIIRLDAPLWHDEIAMVIEFVRQPFGDLFTTFGNDNNHPLYTITATLCARVFGESAWTVRLPAAAFGTASVWMLWVFARGRVSRGVALLATAILALSFHHVWFSQNARGYTALLFFALASSHLMLRALESGERRHWIGHAVCLALCVYVHLTGVFIALGQVAVFAAFAIRRRDRAGIRAGIAGFVLSGVLGLALHAAILGEMYTYFLDRPGEVAAKTVWKDPLWLIRTTAGSLGIGVGPGLVVLGGGLVVLGAGILSFLRRTPAVAGLFLVSGVLCAATMLGMGRNLWPRLFFFLAGFAVLTAAEGLFVLARLTGERFRPKAEIAFSVVVLLACVAVLPRAFSPPKQDYPAALSFVEKRRAEGEPVVTVGLATVAYERYYGAGFAKADTVEELKQLLPPGRAGWVLYSFPIHLESRFPELWEYLEANRKGAMEFPGGVGGGTVTVLRMNR